MAEKEPKPRPKRAKGKAKKRSKRQAGGTSGRARASRCNGALGKVFAKLLEEPHSHQIGVCAKLGIPWQTHMRWMREEPEAGSDVANYQSAVLAALDRQRVLDLESGLQLIDKSHPAKAASYFNFFKHRHDSRFKRFGSDESAQKHEVQLTGKDGGPIETESRVRYVVKVPQEEPLDDAEEFDQE